MSQFLDALTVFGGFATLTGAVINFFFFYLAGRQDANIVNITKSLDKFPKAVDDLNLRLDGLGGRLNSRMDLLSKELRGTIDTLTKALIGLGK